VSLIRPTERAETEIPETDLDGLAYLGGSSLGDLLDAEFEATEASLAAADVPNLRVEIDRVDERGSANSCTRWRPPACCTKLASVSTFTQPAVESGGERRLGDCSAAAISRRPTPWPTSANCGSTAPEPGESISPIPSPWTSGAPNTPCAQPPAMTDDLPVPVDRLTHAASAVFALIFARSSSLASSPNWPPQPRSASASSRPTRTRSRSSGPSPISWDPSRGRLPPDHRPAGSRFGLSPVAPRSRTHRGFRDRPLRAPDRDPPHAPRVPDSGPERIRRRSAAATRWFTTPR